MDCGTDFKLCVNNEYETRGRPFGMTALMHFPSMHGTSGTGGDWAGSASRRDFSSGKLWSSEQVFMKKVQSR